VPCRHHCTASLIRYEAAKKTGEYDAEARRRENAKHSLERYMHYFERWDAHNKAREKVRKGGGSAGGRGAKVQREGGSCEKGVLGRWDAHNKAWEKVRAGF
jgi:hypothetical protein